MMVRDTNPSWCVMRKCGLEPLQFNWFRATVQPPYSSIVQRVYNALGNSSSARKILQADMKLSSRCDDCWLSHILSAKNGLAQSFMFRERLLKCEPNDLSHFVVDLRERIIAEGAI